MPYDTAEARQQLLDGIAEAIDAIGVALAGLGDAYEALDEYSADRLEEELFRPVQSAYGTAKRTYAEFAGRHGLASRSFAAAAPGASSRGVKGFLDRAVQAVHQADDILVGLQDSLLPLEVGDADLRAGLAEVRRLIGDVPGRARRLAGVLGR